MHSTATRILACIAALCLAGCAGGPRPLPRLPEAERPTLGLVGIMTVGPAVGGDVDAPIGGVAGQAVVGVVLGGAAGTAGGIGAGALAAALACGPGAPICGAVLVLGGATMGLVGGSAYGGITRGQDAIPGSIAEQIQTSLTGAISARDLQADLRQRLLRHVGQVTAIDLGTSAPEPVAAPDYSPQAGQGVGAVLETSLTQLTLSGEGGENPTLTLVIAARARLIRIADGRVLWNAEEVRYESSAAEFSLWTARDADLLTQEIDNGLNDLARQIGEALFVPATVTAGL